MSITAAAGFRAAGVAAGIKASGAKDVALVLNDGPRYVAAGVFTTNRFQAAPVQWTRQCVADGELRAVVLNSGGANACTGPDGFADTHRTAEQVAELIGGGAGEVGVCSTGMIGVRLPMALLATGIDAAVRQLSATGGDDAALAIMTTDTRPKQAQLSGGGYAIGGMAKGAGMLAPALATMLVVITTDAVLEPELAKSALAQAAALTFDRIDSDGCMSTNDTVLLLANGASGVNPEPAAFVSALTSVCDQLARQLLADAEGASKEIEIEVTSAATQQQALAAARAIARSNLFKCGVYGEDPNWGRVLAALGTATAEFEPDAVDVAINGIWVCRSGSIGEDRELVDMSGPKVKVSVDLKAGDAAATILTTDLTVAYVNENSAYSS